MNRKRLLVLAFFILISSSVRAEEMWKANAGLSGIFNSGNSVSQTIGGNALVSVKEDMNQITWNGNGAYGRAKDPVSGVRTTNTENWLTQVRYDRFLSENFSLYLLGHMNHDKPAGFDLNYGVSPGLSHFLYKTDNDTFKYELGFDFTRQRFVTNVTQNIYSGRLFLQYTHKFSDAAFFGQDVEGLYNIQDNDDYRINSLSSLNLKMTQKVAFQVGYAIRFDHQPVPGFKKLDTTTQLGLNVNFL